jgi:hypothetical protein
MFLSSLDPVGNLALMVSQPVAARPALRRQSFAAGGSFWFGPRGFAVVLSLLMAATFCPVLIGQKTFFHRDFSVFTYPLVYYQRECFWRGEVPLWNPLNNCGIPLLAQWNTATLYPPSLFYLLFPLPWSLGVFSIGHLVFAGIGMHLLARRWTGSLPAAALAGLAFAFNGLSWHFLMWVSNLAAYAWMPWVVLALESAWREGGRKIALAALAGAAQMLSGAPEIIALTWIFAAVCGLLEGFAQRRDRRSFPLRFGSVALLVAGLSAAQLLPFLDLLAHSDRSSAFTDEEWALPLSGAANFFVPLFHYFPSHHGVMAQSNQPWTASYYLGVGAILLAALAIWRRRSRPVWILTATAVLSLWLACGSEGGLLPALKTLFPQLGYMRYPIKFVALALFAMPLLAAHALAGLESAGPKAARWQKDLRIMTAALLALIGLIVCQAYVSPLDTPFGKENLSITLRNALERAAILTSFCAVLLGLCRASRPGARVLLGLSLLLLQWLDVYTHAPSLNPWVDPSVYRPNLMRKQFALEPTGRTGDPRILLSKTVWQKLYLTSLPGARDDCLFARAAQTDDWNLLDGIPKIDGIYSLFLDDSDRVLLLMLTGMSRGYEVKGAQDFLGVSRVGMDVNAATNGLLWEQRTSFAPFVCAGQRAEFLGPTNTLIEFLTRTSYDPRQTVFLPLAAEGLLSATNSTAARVALGRLLPERLEFEVEAPAPALVTIAQSFYHPWRASVDGRPTRLWQANYAFQAMEVPAGRHQVRLIYQDSFFHYGIAVSAISLMTVCLLWFLKRPSSNRNSAKTNLTP